MKPKSLQEAIDGLKPGEEVELSRANGLWVTAERSGNGKTIRIVRHSDKGFVVIKSHT
jgi:hypothetical protein